ncbi:MFS transporter [Pseudomonas syringae]|nr:MFS transporter [Pseudomonas syringae]EGH71565.1 drug resistance transporter, EmrB/QacA subfamily protein [Pseudomonas syringae pv. aceris str. M302273]KOG03474.1 Drug resistance transporter, EmrB/QacA subfamily protein [Pseudomonas syringae pv. aceris]
MCTSETAAVIETAPREFWPSFLAMSGIALVSMIVALDQTVISTALPSIIADLHGFELYAWVANAYLLASISTVPIFGRLGDVYGRKRFVVASIVIFTVASILCGMSSSMEMLIASRALQGIGGGILVATAFPSASDLFPEARTRVKWQVLISSAYGIGTAAGPSLGGLLTEAFGWRSTFLINLPVGVLCLFCVLRYLPDIRQFKAAGSQRPKIDFAGAGVLAVALICLELFAHGMADNGFDTRNGLTLLMGCLALWGFIKIEGRTPNAIVPLDLFRNRDLVKLLLLSLGVGFSLFGFMLYVPLLLQGGFGLTPKEAGIVATPFAAFIAVGSMINTRVIVRLERPVLAVTFGFTLIAIAALCLHQVGGTDIKTLVSLSVVVAGIGLGFCVNNLNVFSHGIVGRERFGVSTALMQTTRMMGGMIGTTLIGAIVAHTYASGIRSAAPAVLASTNDAALRSTLENPQVLMGGQAGDSLARYAAAQGISLPELLSYCRAHLIDAIQAGFLFLGIVGACAIFITFRLRQLRLDAHKR